MRVNEPDQPVIDAATEDFFLGEALAVRQPRNGYRAGTDAVLLAALLSPETAGKGPILDVGAGVGVVGLCVAARCPDAKVLLVEREPDLSALARHNIERNRLGMRVSVVETDIARATDAFLRSGIASDSFPVVLANPPYHQEGRGTAATSPLKAVSHQMAEDALETWARFMARMAMPGGRVAMIHKAEALPQILSVFEARFGGIGVLPIYPRAGAAAIRVIVSGIKGSRAPITIKPPLILHGPGQGFRPEIEAVFRHGAALPAQFGG